MALREPLVDTVDSKVVVTNNFKLKVCAAPYFLQTRGSNYDLGNRPEDGAKRGSSIQRTIYSHC